jgi:hypothetical protein
VTATIILVCSVVILGQFFVSYCRSLLASSAKESLSPEVQEVTGISAAASGDDFVRVKQLLQLCPEHPQDDKGIQAVNSYFGMLNLLRRTLAQALPKVQNWVDSERGQCTYFMAVCLDRRINFSRDLLTQQSNH